MIKRIHIVAHDVPYPIDYGGVIDIFCTIKTLHQQGFEIILHCFDYGRGPREELEKICHEVFYYERKKGHKGFCFHLPYIVASRSNPDLLERLLADKYPILLEGIHCSFLTTDPRFGNRKIVLRAFNAESLYYKQLFKHERSLLKKVYFLHESRLLRRYEASVASKLPVLTLSDDDKRYFKEILGAKDVHTVPVLLPHQEVTSKEGLGSFCLYHGNLGIAENEKAAAWLLEEVFVKLKIPFVIAGKKPSARLERLAHMGCHTCLVSDPGEKELNDLISKAQINILPSFNETGVKLKLLNALFNGRHCIVNDAAVHGTPLGPLCHVAEKPAPIQRLIQQLYYLPFGEEEIRIREKILNQHFNNEENARAISSYLY
ncbi:glycosyltransferase family 4 protein [Flavihumibacter fluvii]|uniref:glycosyltransferase family 4 protein n=1 Tax=Flavihumibacter fluvii TaxID=2838157 RepID=UPI001BDE8EF8|nr:glycosyltransferase family 4 protein [Flavihumibacter fluvii]ULQ53836.1 glycosyltransferase family 4 protein [Flavihumibacter fluvii]